jgi:putative salt-induced outer membrane protein YdiY
MAVGLVSTSLAGAEDKPKKPWKNVTEASMVSANGNTKSTTYAAKNTYNYDWKKTALELIAGALGSSSKGSTTAEQYFASEKLSYKLSDRNYAFEKFAWDKDRFAGIKNRYDTSVGLGRELLKNDRDLLTAELGGGFVSEERRPGPKNDFASGRAYSKYTHIFTPTATFNQDAEYLHNFEDADDFRTKAETSLISALSANFSLKVGYVWKHVGKPPVGFSRNDTITSVALIATY